MRLVLALGLALLTGACATSHDATESPQRAQLTRAVTAPSRLAPPDYLPDEARLILRTIMGSHAQTMGALVSAIMLLQYEQIRVGAESVAADASLARPLTGDATELNSLLPEKFFQKQDQLRQEAGVLALAAEQQRALSVASAYGRLSETCVSCHATYRAGR